MKKIALAFVITLCTSLSFAGGGWINPKGHGFFMLSERMMFADSYYQADGTTVAIPKTRFFITNLYGEYGLGKNVELNINAPLVYHINKNGLETSSGSISIPQESETNTGDYSIGAKYGFFQDSPIVMALGYKLKLPLGSTSGGSSGLLQTGNGSWENRFQLDASGSISSNWYVSAYSAYNNRSGGFSDEFYYGIETGYSVFSAFLILKVEGLSSLNNGGIESGGSALFSNNIEYLAWTFETLIPISKKWGAELAYNSVFSAKNVIAAPAYQIGVFFKLSEE